MEPYTFCFNIVGLSPSLLECLLEMPAGKRLADRGKKAAMTPVFPCLTLPGQASFSTGTYPEQHGIIANGFFNRDRLEVSFWDQYRSLVQAEPIWEKIKKADPTAKTALLFCQNSLYGAADIIITPKPMHTDDGLIQWCYSKPVGFYEQICKELGQPFNLFDFWGPFASHKSSEWIIAAACQVVKTEAPNFMMTYMPHIDYSAQKYGPDAPEVKNDLEQVDTLLNTFLDTLEEQGLSESSTICLFSEYSLTPVTGAVCLNKVLRENGYLNVRIIENREYLDIEMSRAFAMVDHQVAHIYVKDRDDISAVKTILEQTDGIRLVLDSAEKKAFHINHQRAGELVAVSDADKWFAYYWWEDEDRAPDFAEHIDIHRKPGYDPVELFMDPETFKIPQSPELVKGSHGAPAGHGGGMAVFMLSGAKADSVSLPDEINMVDALPILETLTGINHV